MQSHARLTAAIARASWGVVGLALLIGGLLVANVAADWRGAVSDAQSLRAFSSDARSTADEDATAVADAEELLSAAQNTESAAWPMVEWEIHEQAVAFDLRVEQMAQAGDIQRNPWSGLGLPPAWLMDEFNQQDKPYADAWASAAQSTKDAQGAVEGAKAEAVSSAYLAVVAGEAADDAKADADGAKARMLRAVAVSTVALLLLAIVATSFTIVSSRARAQLGATPGPPVNTTTSP